MRPKITHNRLRAPGPAPTHTREVTADQLGNREQRRAWAKAAKTKMPAAAPSVSSETGEEDR